MRPIGFNLKAINYKHLKYKFILLVLTFLGCISFETFAQGGLLITPNRVTFEGRKQKEQLNLINTGKETATYSVSFVQRRMNEDGSFEIITEPDSGQMFADPYLRIYPRRVTLNPGEAQVVMLQCKRRSDMRDGEYRSHLYFRTEKNDKPLASGDHLKDSMAFSVQLTPIFGMTIPIIIRSGEVNAKSSLGNLKLETDENENPYLTFILNREGNISVYGNLIVDYVPVKGKPFQIGAINGVAVYTNISKRYVAVKLNKTDAKFLKNGKLRLRFTSRDTAKKLEVYAEAYLELKTEM